MAEAQKLTGVKAMRAFLAKDSQKPEPTSKELLALKKACTDDEWNKMIKDCEEEMFNAN